jgi:hypothetical protein
MDVVAVSGVARTSQQTRTTPANFGGCHTTAVETTTFQEQERIRRAQVIAECHLCGALQIVSDGGIMMDAKNSSDSKREPDVGEEFEGSRPGPKTAIFVAVVALAVAGYSYWPQIASALSLN